MCVRDIRYGFISLYPAGMVVVSFRHGFRRLIGKAGFAFHIITIMLIGVPLSRIFFWHSRTCHASPHTDRSGHPSDMVTAMHVINAVLMLLRTQILPKRLWQRSPFAMILILCGSIILSAQAGSVADDSNKRITVLGDSLVAGYGLAPGLSFPDRLEAALQNTGYNIAVVNAGLSGDTTAGGLARLEWSLSDDPAVVIIVLGGNDMLRGLDPAATRTNLDSIITQLKRRNVTVMLTGMLASRNLGPEYVAAFDGLYPALAQKHGIDFYPFFLEGVALDPALNLSDGLHPNADGVDEIVRRILPFVTDMLEHMAG